MRRAGWLLAAALGLAGCAKPLAALAPFPCAVDGTCPAGFVCTEGRCEPPACAHVTTTGSCAACGPAAPIDCGNGTSCGPNSKCASGGCPCEPDFFVADCGGRPCTNCSSYASYWCKPASSAAPGCGDRVLGFGGSCECSDGRTVPFGCGEVSSCETLCRRCDPRAPATCPQGTKCTMHDGDGGMNLRCEPTADTLALGAPCARTAPGEDDCVSGAFCTGTNYTDAPSCHRICRQPADCDPSERCIANDGFVNLDGICWPACTPFAGGCPTGYSCKPGQTTRPLIAATAEWAGLCTRDGPGAPGASCAGSFECGHDLACAPNAAGQLRCTPLCDDQHPCRAIACQALAPLALHAGVCP